MKFPATTGRPHVAKTALPDNPAGFTAGYAVVIITGMGNKMFRIGIIAIATATKGIVIIVAITTRLADADMDFNLGFRNLCRKGKGCRKACCH